MSDPTPLPATTPPPAPAGTGPVRQSRGPSTLQLGIVVAILAVGIIVTAMTSDVTRLSEPGIRLVDDRPFLPENAGAWKGGEQTGLTEEERRALPSDTEGVRRIYKDSDGRMVYCSVVLAGKDVTSIHRPELCLTGQGWKLSPTTTESVAMPSVAGGQFEVSRMNAINTLPDKTEAHAVFVYWFVGKDRTTPHHLQRIWWTMVDRVFHSRNHRWAYFLISAVSSPEKAARDSQGADDDSMQMVRRFVQDLYPQLTPQ